MSVTYELQSLLCTSLSLVIRLKKFKQYKKGVAVVKFRLIDEIHLLGHWYFEFNFLKFSSLKFLFNVSLLFFFSTLTLPKSFSAELFFVDHNSPVMAFIIIILYFSCIQDVLGNKQGTCLPFDLLLSDFKRNTLPFSK